VFIAAGSAFANYTEHWPLATPPVDHRLPATGMAAVQAAAAVGVLILIMAGLACLPVFVQFICRRDGARCGQ
jgi:LPXTG-motif cell wall-anchored protein